MYRSAFILSAILIMLNACGSRHFVHKGHTSYTIFLEEPDQAQQLRAAKLLQSYVLKISGAALLIDSISTEIPERAIVFKIQEELDPDGFLIQRKDDQLLISGGPHKGCIYGVIHLLEKEWGCRMYSPDFEWIPSKTDLVLPETSVSDQPENSYRIINGRFCMNPDYQDWQRLDLVDDQFAKGYYVHTFNRLIPWEENFDSHPEYYSLVQGKRIKDQLCLTNPDVLEKALEKLKNDMAAQPDKVLWSVSQNDNFSFCQCADCQSIIDEEQSPAGPIIRFVNSIAEEFPDKIISTLAYQYSRKAPVLTKPASNVQIMLCTIELNRSQAIAEDPRSVSFLKDIEDWGKIANHIYLWDYTVNFSHHSTPFPNIHVLQPNIQLFTNNGVHHHFQQSNTDIGHEFSELKSYLISRLLWNPDINTDSVIAEFMEGYYGDAASLINKYRESMEQDVLESKEWLDIYGHPTAHENTFLAEEKLNQYQSLFLEARTLVEGDSARRMHVREAQLPLQYAAMEIGKNQMFESRGWYRLDGDQFLLRPAMAEMLEDFISTCRMIGVHSLNEAGLKPEDYYQATKRFIQVQVVGNRAFRRSVVAEPTPSNSYSKGDIRYLTNGVQGASDYKVHWLGWEAQDFEIVLDLERPQEVDSVFISSLYDPKSWIFHPAAVSCQVSLDGRSYEKIATQKIEGDQRKEPVTRTYGFEIPQKAIQFVRFQVLGTHQNPRWHPSAGGKSWVFLDEIVAR